MKNSFACKRLAKIEAQIDAAEDALLEYSGDGVISYTMNTGQTVTTVTKSSLNDMLAYIDALYARRDSLAQLCGKESFAFNATPGW